jgi:hypothetical protein
MLFSLVFLFLALRTQQIPEALSLTRSLTSPARRRVTRKGRAALRRQHGQQRRLVRTDLLAERIVIAHSENQRIRDDPCFYYERSPLPALRPYIGPNPFS